MSPDELVYTSSGIDNVAFVAQMKGMSLQQETKITPDHALFLWIEDEDVMLTNIASTSKDGAPFV